MHVTKTWSFPAILKPWYMVYRGPVDSPRRSGSWHNVPLPES